MKILWVIVLLASVISVSRAQGGTTADSDMASKVKKTQSAMYAVLRALVLPGEEKNVTQRFVLSIPGKVLNYADYYPGDGYVEAMKHVSDNEKEFVDVPPKIMQNMFRLADVVPGVNPMRGGDTGQSFVDLYEHVLNNLDVRGFRQKGYEAQKRYREAIKFLSDPIPDPEDLHHVVARMDLYRRLQRRYNQKRRDAEKTIADKRKELGSLDYQFWFQRNFPVLYSEVEGAYAEWLVFGQKDLVELYKAHIDTESQGVDLEEARMLLRSSGFIALDRSSTIYPVAFEPSNWYEALVPKVKGPTRDEIQTQIGDLKARKVMLEMIRDGVASDESEALIDDLKRKRQEKEDLMRDKMADLQKKRNRCLEQRRTKPSVPLVGGSEEKEDSCQQYRDAQSAAKQAASEQGEVEAELDNTEFLTATSDKSRQTLERQIGGIDARIRQLQTRLEGAAAPSTEVAEDSEESIGMKETDMDTSWMEFEFDTSRTEEVRSEQEKRMSYDFEVEASGHYATQGWSSAASSSFDMNAQSFAQEMSTAECRVKAKVLKVTIKRPWFKTSLFRSRHFSTRDGGTISPGPMPEDELIFELSKRSYGLPEYATAFLLAKDVEMDFRGVSSKTVSSALSMSASGKFEGGYGPFSATTRTAAAGASSNVATQATTDGLKIRIPGAQIIGYYLHVVPRFPIKAVGDEY